MRVSICTGVLQIDYSYYGQFLEPASTFAKDYWQHELGVPIRVHNMMNHYSLVMDEEEALRCLQYGHYGSGFPGQTTNWSYVYNPAQRTVLFVVRNQTDKAFSIDLKEDLK